MQSDTGENGLKIFDLNKYDTTVRREIVAGLTTFTSMSYIFLVNPGIMEQAGIPAEAAFAATVLASILPTLFMALAANLPVVLAPGMGVNAFFTYTLVQGAGLSWQSALGAVFLSGLLFAALALTPVPAYIVRGVPRNLKSAVGAGIGLFIAVIGFQNAGFIQADPDTMLALGDLKKPGALLACAGLLLTAVLMSRGVRGAILLGILGSTALGMLTGEIPLPDSAAQMVSLHIPDPSATFMQMEILPLLKLSFISVLFSMTMVDMFNALSTLIGISRPAGLIEKDADGVDRIRGLQRAMLADGGGTLLGGLLGTSPVTSYLESITGIAEGGRTGLTALVAACLFVFCLFFAPLVRISPAFATAPALIIVGVLMLRDVQEIDFGDMSDALPAFLTVISMPLTCNIVTGFGLGFISHVLLKVLTLRLKEISPVMWLAASCFFLHFALT